MLCFQALHFYKKKRNFYVLTKNDTWKQFLKFDKYLKKKKYILYVSRMLNKLVQDGLH